MSLLSGILERLESLIQQSTNGEVAQRFFEVNGERKCSVKYSEKNAFELEVFRQGEKPQTFPYDNIDMLAIEIYELIS
ncbi:MULTISPECIES: YkuJ family protein [Gottfriedia]|jgi:uncharacterized protein YkuJ|uniref:DUF1797 domain-containing protein n=1 Tax=Gottfriedia solisilvae TaxID=1516104 RepID=A0A8J3APM6_9BACI|nr:YkuJ family protein [Gottfriedia solisilvae]GGI14582.1 hypothetical protein GCM10007380_23660 [Gottfriedia solisilvae]